MCLFFVSEFLQGKKKTHFPHRGYKLLHLAVSVSLGIYHQTCSLQN